MNVSTSANGPMLLKLPLEIRIIIFREVLIVARPVHLYRDRWPYGDLIYDSYSSEGDREQSIKAFVSNKRKHWLALLHSNRQLRIEAGQVLYNCNRFYFEDDRSHDDSLVISFINQIGCANAASLSYISMNFPSLATHHFSHTGNLTLAPHSLEDMRTIGQHCTSLKTLELNLHDRDTIATMVYGIGNDASSVKKLISSIDYEFRCTIVSLHKISVHINGRWPMPGVAGLLSDFGWLVTSTTSQGISSSVTWSMTNLNRSIQHV